MNRSLHVLVGGLSALLLVAAVPARQTQAPTPSSTAATKLEAFQIQTGTVVVKGFSEVGRLAGLGFVYVRSMELTDPATGRRQAGVQIEVKESGQLESTNRSFIDYDEVDALLKGLDYIGHATPSVTKLSDFEATYKTRGHFSATTFSSSSGKIEASVESGYIGATTAFISLEQLAELRNLIAQAKQRLDAAGVGGQ